MWILILFIVKSDVPTMFEMDYSNQVRCESAGKDIQAKINEAYEDKMSPPTIIWTCVKK